MSIKCGKCQGRHSSTAEVRSCYAGMERPAFAEHDWDAAMQAREAAEDRQRAERKWGSFNQDAAERGTITPAQADRYDQNEARRNGHPGRRLGNPAGIQWNQVRPARTDAGEPVATDSQLNYVNKLYLERDIPERVRQATQTALDANRISKSAASGLITFAKQQVTRAAHATCAGSVGPAAEAVTEDGIYRHPDTRDWYKVQWNRASGDGRKLYAKVLAVASAAVRGPGGTVAEPAEVEWLYQPGLIAKIRPEWRATAEDARQFGELYGRCMNCRRVLTREESIERAMGPICWGRLQASVA